MIQSASLLLKHNLVFYYQHLIKRLSINDTYKEMSSYFCKTINTQIDLIDNLKIKSPSCSTKLIFQIRKPAEFKEKIRRPKTALTMER